MMSSVALFLRRGRHIIALFCAIVSIYVIKTITVHLYFYSGDDVGLFDVIYALWHTQKPYYQFLVFMNFIFKPLFIYYLVVVILSYEENVRK